MEPKIKSLIPLIIIFFIFGAVVGYVAHMPATIVQTKYINQTVEVPKIVKETVVVTVTPIPISPAPTPVETQAVPDFTVKIYDPSTDVPTSTIELKNQRFNPDTLSISPGSTVLIKITEVALSSPLTLILNSSYSQNLGTSGAVVVTFNKRGTYSLEAIIPRGQSVNPLEYGKGTVTVY